MAQPHHPTVSYPSTHYVESAGCIQFVLPTTQHPEPRVIVIYYSGRKGYLLAKGRRNIKEARAIAAVRETTEETGLVCTLLPLRLHARNPPEIEEDGYTPDEVRTFDDVIEPFMMSTRDVTNGNVKQIKLIWWYIAVVEKNQPEGLVPEPGLTPTAMKFDEAVKALKYQCDQEVLMQAIKVFEENWKLVQVRKQDSLADGQPEVAERST